MSTLITALYDCRSKQQYIYRTNKIKEIAGASALLSNVYSMFIEKCLANEIKIENNWKKENGEINNFSKLDFEKSDFDATVIYEGGGNLYLLYKSKDIYIKANMIFSKMLLDETYTISIVASCTETGDNFNDDRRKLYVQNKEQKNLGTYSIPCNVLPFTLMDKNTWFAVTNRISGKLISKESKIKLDSYDKYCCSKSEIQSVNLDSLVWNKGDESLLAVIYIDGNAMGNKIKALTENISDYDECVNRLRKFSVDTDRIFVRNPICKIEEMLSKKIDKNEKNKNLHKYRKIIGGGDEITIICNARDAKDIVLTYFDTLDNSESLVENSINASCAGIAIFHSHDPFSEVYKIAEAACEEGKKKTRDNESKDNYVDFHYCHSSVIGDLETIRESQEKNITARPYLVSNKDEYTDSDFKSFIKKCNMLKEIGRANIKELRDCAFDGQSYFDFEIERILSRYPQGEFKKLYLEYSGKNEEFKKLIYDAALIYDLWLADERKEGE